MSPSPKQYAFPPPRIRPERPTDAAAIHQVHTAAFETGDEADLVDSLRRDGDLTVSLVAELDDATQQGGEIVGHIALSPVTLDGEVCAGVGLAPVAVWPEYQRRGIGGMLVDAGIAACREAGCSLVVVLGEPAYYGRFGFRPASDWGLESEYTAGDAFMAQLLGDGSSRPTMNQPVAMPRDGLIRYATAFASLL